ncbi:hypothetical protein BRADI_1g75810v3 [Brachypodium distachyon]|uniref:Omega-hydroxypalmitate O-feruloyl transferase n=1 Tax=Brachypodium distachyon TaxID=15368 RepID=A0A2K2DVE4_BRADI|nr:hypothetical protein BRADI_1g75810v3 [Brachypodium distachyon]
MGFHKRAAAAGASSIIQVSSRRLVKASDTSIQPHVAAVSHLDLITNCAQASVRCVYRKPTNGDLGCFSAVVAAFEAHLPSLLNHFFSLAGRIVIDRATGVPELHCFNQGAELVVGHADLELCGMDWGLPEESLGRIQVPYAEDLPLSVQLLSFACGGFAVVWATNTLIGDGNVGVMLVRMFSELSRTGTLSWGGPTHDSKPRDPPSYGTKVASMFTPWDHEHQVNALTAEESFVGRLYYVEAQDIARLRADADADAGAGTGRQRAATRVQAMSAYLWKVLARIVATSKLLSEDEKRCRLLWWVDGRRRFSAPELRARLQNYAGNVTSYVVADAAADRVLGEPMSGVAGMVRDAIAEVDYDEMYQQMVDWMEVHKPGRFVETSTVGLGSPTLAQTMWSSFKDDTDFGFGKAALAMPAESSLGRLCMAMLSISAKPGDPGTWLVSACIWPRLAAALESDPQRIFKPLNAEYLGFTHAAATARPRL